jgi:magnesium-transporting ATPase (P-type)
MKGAPEVVREYCTSMLKTMDSNNLETTLDNDKEINEKIDETITNFTSEKKKYRTIMLAYKKYKLDEFVKEFGIQGEDFAKVIKHFNEGT